MNIFEHPEIKLQFKAGKMVIDASGRIKPDSREGIIRLIIENNVKMLKWIDSKTSKEEDKIILTKEDAIFEKVKQSKGRVYILRFKSSKNRHFFYMQEQITEKDDNLCSQVEKFINYSLNDEIIKEAESKGPDSDENKHEEEDDESDEEEKLVRDFARDLTSAIRVMNRANNPNEAVNPPHSSGTGGHTHIQVPGPSANVNPASNSSIQDLVSQAFGTGNQAEALIKMLQESKPKRKSPHLPTLLNSSLNELEKDTELENILLSLLPPEHRNHEEYVRTLHSPQLIQALEMLDSALNTEQIQVLLMTFGLDSNIIKESNDGVEAFLKAIIKQFGKK